MAVKKGKFGGRSYKKGYGKKSTSKPFRKGKKAADEEEEEEERRPRGRKGGGQRRGRGRSDDSEFVHITGLFKSESGKSHTVFLNDDILNKLRDLEPDDLLGISRSEYGYSLWVRKAE